MSPGIVMAMCGIGCALVGGICSIAVLVWMCSSNRPTPWELPLATSMVMHFSGYYQFAIGMWIARRCVSK